MTIARCAALVAVALLGAVTLAACTSGSSGKSPSTPAGTTSAASSSAAASPSASPSTTAPSSPYEADPGVIAARAWAVQVRAAVNAQNLQLPALVALETSAFQTTYAAQVLQPDFGKIYDVPVPFTPVNVVVDSATQRTLNSCVAIAGYALDPTTKQPSAPVNIAPAKMVMTIDSGTWKINAFYDGSAAFNCTGVKVTP